MDLDGSTTITLAGDTTTDLVGMQFDIAGQDFSAHLTFQFMGETFSEDVIEVGGNVYTSFDGGDWTLETQGLDPNDFLDPGFPIDPSSGLSAADVTYSGSTTGPGPRYHRLDIDTLPSVDPSALGIRNPSLKLIDFYVRVDDNGLPIDGHMSYSVSGRVARRKFQAVYELGYQFSNYNEPLTITPPIGGGRTGLAKISIPA